MQFRAGTWTVSFDIKSDQGLSWSEAEEACQMNGLLNLKDDNVPCGSFECAGLYGVLMTMCVQTLCTQTMVCMCVHDGQCCTLTTVCKCAQMAGVCMDWQQCVHGQQRVREDSMRTDDGVCICANSVCTDDSGVYMDDTIASGRYGRCVY
eukprot:Opistho-2@92042